MPVHRCSDLSKLVKSSTRLAVSTYWFETLSGYLLKAVNQRESFSTKIIEHMQVFIMFFPFIHQSCVPPVYTQKVNLESGLLLLYCIKEVAS